MTIPMQHKHIGMIGLGKMGANLVRRLQDQAWKVTGYDVSDGARAALKEEGLDVVDSVRAVVEALPSPRALWLMVPAGQPFDDLVFGDEGLVSMLAEGDLIIDGGNSQYEDSARRGARLAELGIHFLDVGTSGGPEGARTGPCLMIGGYPAVYKMWQSLFTDLALPEGVQHFSGFGAGHFVKMVHNGIEYGMMQSLAEGFALMKASEYRFDLEKVADLYNHGSVVESRLVGWAKDGLTKYGQNLEGISGSVAHTGEGEWTVKAGEKIGVPVASIKLAFDFRVASGDAPSYMGKFLSMLRNMFGGHAAK